LVLIAASSPDGSEYSDLNVYYGTAKELTSGSDAWLATEGNFGYRAPLYFVYLAIFYKLPLPQTYQVGQAANLLLVVATILLLYRVTNTWFGPGTATVVALLRAVLPTFVVSDTLLMSEVLFSVFLLLVLLFLPFKRNDEHRMRDAFVVGLAGGAAVLTREYAQGLVLVFLVLLLVVPGSKRDKLKTVPLAAIGLLVALAPWLVRNTAVWGSPFPLMTTSGVNLHIGNHPHAQGVYSIFEHPDHVTPAHLAQGSRAYNQWHLDKATRYILDSPARFLAIGVKKVGFLTFPYALRGELMISGLFPRMSNSLLLVLVLTGAATYALVWIFGLVGLLVLPLNTYGKILLSILAYTTVIVFIAFGTPRQAAPVILMLLAPAATAVMDPRKMLRSLRLTSPGALIVWGALVLLGLLWIFTLFNRRGL
jgi:4-amino-4-deoxy-L-arabinose transferase-like glycosyltransferase